MVVNKYGIELPESLVIQYYDDLIGNIFKILPIFEGRSCITKDITLKKEEAYEQFMKYVQNLSFEIAGADCIFTNNRQFIKLLSNIEGMQKIKIDEHKKLRSLWLNCIDICKKMKGLTINGV